MGLSAEKVAELEQLKVNVSDAFDKQLEEIDDQVVFLRAVDVSVSALSENTVEVAATRALSTIQATLAS
jgi:hypothetical protein